MSLVNAPWIQRARKLKNMTPREISNFQTIFKTIQNRFEKQKEKLKAAEKPKRLVQIYYLYFHLLVKTPRETITQHND